MQQFSLKGDIQHILAYAKDYDLRAYKVATSFRTKRAPQVLENPWLEKLPYPVQILIIQQMKQGEENIEDGEDYKELDDEVKCDCGFYRRYQLLCRHIWANHVLYRCLTSEHFLRWTHMWEDSGFEIYETMGTVYFERDIDEDVSDLPMRQRLYMREALDSLKERYYQIEETIQDWESSEADRFMKWWLQKLHHATGEVWKQGIEQFEIDTGVKVRSQNLQRVQLGAIPPNDVPISTACR
jgi:hypothetical protein